MLLAQLGHTALVILSNLEDHADLLRHLTGPLTGLTLLLALMALMKQRRRRTPRRWAHDCWYCP